MRTPIENQKKAITQYCERCENRGCSGIVFCDSCPSTCCVHLSGKVNEQLWCVRCIKEAGLNPDILFRWFWFD
jgi:hypothetical protein